MDYEAVAKGISNNRQLDKIELSGSFLLSIERPLNSACNGL